MPERAVSVNRLPKGHPAAAYLIHRGFSLDELAVRWGVSYCENGDTKPRFTDRILVPIYAPVAPASAGEDLQFEGWQARVVGEDSPGPKYLTSAGMAKSKLLYGLPAVLDRTGPVLICEGVTDVWRCGLDAVALFGKTMSSQQMSLMHRHLSGRPLVVFLDRDAEDEAQAILRALRCAGQRASSNNRAVRGALPAGRKDLGECTRQEILKAVCRALRLNVDQLDLPRDRYVILASPSRLGPDALGNWVGVSYATCNRESEFAGLDRIIGISLVGQDGARRYVARGLKHWPGPVQGRLAVYHDALSAKLQERREEMVGVEKFDDVRIMAHLLDENCLNDLASISQRYLPPEVHIVPDGAASPSALAATSAVVDAELIAKAYYQGDLPGRIKRSGLDEVYRQIELPIVDVAADMMVNGMRVDLQRLRQRRQTSVQQIEDCQSKIARIAGRKINLGSAEEVQHLLFDELNLTAAGQTRSGQPSTIDRDLKKLVKQDSSGAVEVIRKYRQQAQTLRWCKNLAGNADKATQRVHFVLDPLGAATGRFSCSGLGLQSIPRSMLDLFVAENGHRLIEADYSQIELRVLAHYSKEPAWVRGYRVDAIDVHRQTAAMVLGIPVDRVTEVQRNQIGKEVNFAIIYGQTAHGLAEKLDVSIPAAEEFLHRYFEGFPSVAAWIGKIEASAVERAIVQTLYGRRRRLPEIRSNVARKRDRALRQAVNAVIQGTAADINKLALIRLYSELPSDCRLLMTVHDSVLLEVPEQQVSRVVRQARMVMQQAPPRFSIPLRVDIHVGRTWAQCKSSRAV